MWSMVFYTDSPTSKKKKDDPNNGCHSVRLLQKLRREGTGQEGEEAEANMISAGSDPQNASSSENVTGLNREPVLIKIIKWAARAKGGSLG